MQEIIFPQNVERVFKAFSSISKEIGEHPIIIGGFIRDHIVNGSSDGDIDVVLRYGKNFSFVSKLKALGASDSDVFGNTGTLHLVYNNCEIEVQSSNNPLVHFNIDDELIRMGLDLNWINRNVYERDFTFNTIIYDPSNGQIIDATGTGIRDLIKDKILRCPIDPSVALKNNPIIITRAIKFSLDFGLSIDPLFIENSIQFKNAFVDRINHRHNRHYLKSYIRQTFDMDFEKTYDYYDKIGFLDAIPMGEELENQISQRRMGIVYRKPINKKVLLSKYYRSIKNAFGKQMMTYMNPSINELNRIESWQDNEGVRAALLPDANVLVWDAYKDHHLDIQQKLGLFQFTGLILKNNGIVELTENFNGEQDENKISTNNYLIKLFGDNLNIKTKREIEEELYGRKEDKTVNNDDEKIRMKLDEERNILYANFNVRDISLEHKIAFLDLLNKEKININTKLSFLDTPHKTLNVNCIFDDNLRKTSVQIDKHLYDSIKGKQEYKDRKKKEHKKKTLKMYKVLDKVKKIVEHGDFYDKKNK